MSEIILFGGMLDLSLATSSGLAKFCKAVVWLYDDLSQIRRFMPGSEV